MDLQETVLSVKISKRVKIQHQIIVTLELLAKMTYLDHTLAIATQGTKEMANGALISTNARKTLATPMPHA